MSTTEEIIANSIYELKQKFGETKITAETIHLVLKETIELVEDYSCPGSEKKEHVVTIVKALVIDLVEDVEEKRIILEIIEKKILENTIDLIIQATKGKLNINNNATQRKMASCIKTSIVIIIDTVMYILNSTKKSKSKSKSKQPSAPVVTTITVEPKTPAPTPTTPTTPTPITPTTPTTPTIPDDISNSQRPSELVVDESNT